MKIVFPACLAKIRGRKAWLGVVLAGTLAAFVLPLMMVKSVGAAPQDGQVGLTNAPAASAGTVSRLDDDLAMRYARAVEEGDCETILRLTWWVHERLEQVGFEPGPADRVDRERDRLCNELLDRLVEHNALERRGIEDAYVFRPGAAFKFVRTDGGRKDLDKRVVRRTWIHVTYANPAQAPCDEAQRPIRSLVAGVNISADGYVLKANIIGNVEIDYGSLSYDWSPVTGG